jgi:hypothetical protein
MFRLPPFSVGMVVACAGAATDRTTATQTRVGNVVPARRAVRPMEIDK